MPSFPDAATIFEPFLYSRVVYFCCTVTCHYRMPIKAIKFRVVKKASSVDFLLSKGSAQLAFRWMPLEKHGTAIQLVRNNHSTVHIQEETQTAFRYSPVRKIPQNKVLYTVRTWTSKEGTPCFHLDKKRVVFLH